MTDTNAFQQLDLNRSDGRSSERRVAQELDSDLAIQTKRQIRELVIEITELARQDWLPYEFYRRVLVKICDAMSANGAAVWARPRKQADRWYLLADHRLEERLADLHPSFSGSPLLDENFKLEGNTDHRGSPTTKRSSVEEIEKALDRINASVASVLQTDSEPPEDLASESQHSTDCEDAFELPTDSSDPFYAHSEFRPTPDHRKILDAVASEQQPILVPPSNTRLEHERPSNPIDDCLILIPIPFESLAAELWLEIVQPPSGGPATQRGFLRFAAQMADVIADFLKSHRLRELESKESQLMACQELVADLANASSRKFGIQLLVDRLADMFPCRQIVLMRRSAIRSAWKIEAINGHDAIDASADGSLSIVEFSRAIGNSSIAVKDGQWFSQREPTAANESNVPDIDTLATDAAVDFDVARIDASNTMHHREVEELLEIFQADSVCWHPLAMQSAQGDRVALISIHDAAAEIHKLSHPLQATAKIGLNILHPNWWSRANSQVHRIVRPLTWRRPVQAFLLGCVASIVLAFPVPVRLRTMGILYPADSQRVFAPTDATVADVYVAHGEAVKAGKPLLRLEDRNLTARLAETVARQSLELQQLREVSSRLIRGAELSSSELDQLEAQQETLRATLLIREEQLQRLRGEESALTLRADRDGIVNCWDAQRSLANLPVRRGTELLKVNAKDSNWILETKIPECDVQAFQRKRIGARPRSENQVVSHNDALNASPAIEKKQDSSGRFTASYGSTLGQTLQDEQLIASVYMVANPQREIKGRLVAIDGMLAAAGQDWLAKDPVDSNSQYLSVWFAVPKEHLELPIEGSAANVKIDIGRAPLGWALTRDFITSAIVKLRMWF